MQSHLVWLLVALTSVLVTVNDQFAFTPCETDVRQVSPWLRSPRSTALQSEAKGDAAKEALAVVNQLFEAMRGKDAAAMRAAFSAEGQLTATQRRNGQPSLRVYNGEAFAKLIVETKGVLKERMYKPETLASGDLVTVRGRYGFYVDDRFSHCGTNSFHLMPTADGWKIVNAASTIEIEGCEPEAKEKQ